MPRARESLVVPRRVLRAAGMACVLALPAAAQDGAPPVRVGGLIDLRYAHTDSERSWLDRGLGKLRYGASAAGGAADLLRLSQMSLLLDAEPSLELAAHVQLNIDAEPDENGLRNRADLVEAFVRYRPELSPSVRLNLKGGAFFPPVSLENFDAAWTSPYTITSSAINAWVGEELKTIGLEGSLIFRKDANELRLTGAGFGSNDPAGTLLGWRGWTLHDRQSGFGDRLPLPPLPGLETGQVFDQNADWVQGPVEIDGRLGWYAGGAFRLGPVSARGMHYDNRGDQTIFDGKQYAWYTRFDSFGLRIELPAGVELLAQHLQGETRMGKAPTGEDMVKVPFRASYGLLSIPIRRHRLSVRYDRFLAEDEDVLLGRLDPNDEEGDAWTACYAFAPTPRQRLAFEVVHVSADRTLREVLGLPLRGEETLVQVSWRLAF